MKKVFPRTGFEEKLMILRFWQETAL